MDRKQNCRDYQCPFCNSCKYPKEFQLVANLENVLIYRHWVPKHISETQLRKDHHYMFSSISKSDIIKTFTSADNLRERIKGEVFIIHNKKNYDIRADDVMQEFDKNKVDCPRCQYIIKQSQKLLKDIPVVKKFDIRGVCDVCRLKQNQECPCHNCEEIVFKFKRLLLKDDEIMSQCQAYLQRIYTRRSVENIYSDHERIQFEKTDSELDHIKFSLENIAPIKKSTPKLSSDISLQMPAIVKKDIPIISPGFSLQMPAIEKKVKITEDITYISLERSKMRLENISKSGMIDKNKKISSQRSTMSLENISKSDIKDKNKKIASQRSKMGLENISKTGIIDKNKKISSQRSKMRLDNIPKSGMIEKNKKKIRKHHSEGSVIKSFSELPQYFSKERFQYFFPVSKKSGHVMTHKKVSHAQSTRDIRNKNEEKDYEEDKKGKVIKLQREQNIKKEQLIHEKKEEIIKNKKSIKGEQVIKINKEEKSIKEKKDSIKEKREDKHGNMFLKDKKGKDFKENNKKNKEESMEKHEKMFLKDKKGKDIKENYKKKKEESMEKHGKMFLKDKKGKDIKENDKKNKEETMDKEKRLLGDHAKKNTKIVKDQKIGKPKVQKEDKVKIQVMKPEIKQKPLAGTKENKMIEAVIKRRERDAAKSKYEGGRQEIKKDEKSAESKTGEELENAEDKTVRENELTTTQSTDDIPGKTISAQTEKEETVHEITGSGGNKIQEREKKVNAQGLADKEKKPFGLKGRIGKQVESDRKKGEDRKESEKHKKKIKKKDQSRKSISTAPTSDVTETETNNNKPTTSQQTKLKPLAYKQLFAQFKKEKQKKHIEKSITKIHKDQSPKLLKKLKRLKSKTCTFSSALNFDKDSLLGQPGQPEKKIKNKIRKMSEIIYREQICDKRNLKIPHEKGDRHPLFFGPIYDDTKGTVYEESKTETKVDSGINGVLRYALSDRANIDKGWTILPTEKTVRKINVYRMHQSRPDFDWFNHNKTKSNIIYYNTGEKLAEFTNDENDVNRWFYRNGGLALEYYKSKESHTGRRYVIYSDGEPDELGQPRPVTVLAMFDQLGNGVVYNQDGDVRLKYNQNEGIVIDPKLGPNTHWKWHPLNDPPELLTVMEDEKLQYKDPTILQFSDWPKDKPREVDLDMVAIELDNLTKEKAKKISKDFTPFQIRMKALKINDQFSLKILDQSRIHLIYRDGPISLRQNLGLVLDHKDLVDISTAELDEVTNSLEKLPAETDSIVNLQLSLDKTKAMTEAVANHAHNVRPPRRIESIDKMTAALSRPLHHIIPTLPTHCV